MIFSSEKVFDASFEPFSFPAFHEMLGTRCTRDGGMRGEREEEGWPEKKGEGKEHTFFCSFDLFFSIERHFKKTSSIIF